MWRAWKRQSRPQGTRSASRACGFQPLSRPVRIWMTEEVCTSIMIGATSAESTISVTRLAAERRRRPRAAGSPRKAAVPSSFGREEHQHAEPEERHGALGVDARPVREQRPAVEEVVGRHQVGVQRQRHAGEQEQQPERRGEVGHHPHEQVQPAQRVQAGGAEQAGVLQVALAPAAVAGGELDQVRRRVLVAAGEVVGHPHRPAAAAQEGGLDEVVAEDQPAERGLAGQLGQAAAVGEGPGADDGVVAPVVAGVAEPGAQAAGEHRAVDAAGELLDAGERGLAADQAAARSAGCRGCRRPPCGARAR